MFMYGVQEPYAQNRSNYRFSSSQSSISFTARHMKFLEVIGTFTDFDGTLFFPVNKSNLQKTKGNLEILVESINTDNSLRDKSLVSDSFLNAAIYPVITVNLVSIKANGDEFQAVVSVEIMGISTCIKTPLKILFPNPDSKEMELKGTIELSRTELGLQFDSSMDGLIADEVTVSFNLKAIRY